MMNDKTNSNPTGICLLYYWKLFPCLIACFVLLRFWAGSNFIHGGATNFLRFNQPSGLYGPVKSGSFTSLLDGNVRILVTGAAGFIGSHVVQRLKKEGVDIVVGIDNFNDYYSTELKLARAHKILDESDVNILNIDVCDKDKLVSLFTKNQFTHVLHLAAQPGVRYSRNHPHVYIRNNVECFTTLLEVMVHPPLSSSSIKGLRNNNYNEFKERQDLVKSYEMPYFVYASSSSVYGLNSANKAFSESDRVDLPSNLYGATKRSNEQMALAYHNLYGLRSVGCRFFTVYGPWGRPDMALQLFADAIDQGKPVKLFNGGKMARDFTFISDIVDGIIRILEWRSSDGTPQVFNLGNKSPVQLLDFVKTLEKYMGKKANIIDGGESKGEVLSTHSDVSLAENILRFRPRVDIDQGIKEFVKWYQSPSRKPEFSKVAS